MLLPGAGAADGEARAEGRRRVEVGAVGLRAQGVWGAVGKGAGQ